MYYSVELFPSLVLIKDSVEIIKNELDLAIQKDDTVRKLLDVNDELLDHYTNYWVKDNGFHTEQTGLDVREGKYFAAGIYKKDFPIKHFDALSLFPKTIELIKNIDGVEFAGFFKLCTNSRALPHKHNRKHLVFHMMLNDLNDGEYIVICNGEKKVYSKTGECHIFDYSYEHEAQNTSKSTDRINLLIDFKPDFLV